MDDNREMAWAGWAGLAFFALLVASVFVAGSSYPAGDASVAKIREFWTDHRSALLIGNLLTIASYPFLIVFAVGLRDAARRAEGDRMTPMPTVVLASALFTGAVVFVASALSVAILYTDGFAAQVGADTVRVMWNTQGLLYGAIGVSIFAFLAAFSLSIMRSHLFQAWEAWFGTAAALVALAGATAVMSPSIGNYAFLCAGALGIWSLVTSVTMIMRASVATREHRSVIPAAMH